jgi:hypothetical protein
MKAIILIIITVVFTISCKKDGNEVVTEKTTLEYLSGTTSKKWKVSSGLVKNGDQEINLLSIQGPCITDNLLVLFKNFSYELQEGATKCDPVKDPDLIVKANWKLDDAKKVISIDKFIFANRTLNNADFQITEINDDVFKGKTKVAFDGQNLDVTITFQSVK